MAPFWWVNPRSEPEEMVEAAFAVTNVEVNEAFYNLSDAEVGFVIADAYNKAADMGVTPIQTDPEGTPYFTGGIDR